MELEFNGQQLFDVQSAAFRAEGSSAADSA